MSSAGEVTKRLLEAGLGFLLEEARPLVERMSATRQQIVDDPGLLRGVLRPALTPDRRRPIAGLFGRKYLTSSTCAIRLATVHERIGKIQPGVSLLDVLEVLSGPIRTRGDARTDHLQSLEEAYASLSACAPAAMRWINVLSDDTPSGRWFRRAWTTAGPEAALATARSVASAVADLPAPGEHLAVFAAKRTGDPHKFDIGTPSGQLLLLAIGELFGDVPGRGDLPESIWRALQLGHAGLEVDSISSDILIANAHGFAHPVLDAMATYGGGWKLPLREARSLAVPRHPGRPAYVLENPPAFEALVDRTRMWPAAERPLLLCTAGFLSAAAHVLLSKLVSGGFRVVYAGDFDANGILIASMLQECIPGLDLWRMEPSDYRAALAASAEKADDMPPETARRLSTIHGELRATAEALLAENRPAYQELIVERLWSDLERVLPKIIGEDM